MPWLLALIVVLNTGGALAQSAPPQMLAAEPPITIKGWRYEKEQKVPGLHTFYCDPPQCTSKSTVVYQFYPQKLQMTFEQYRQSAEQITKAMQGNNTQGVRFELLGVDDASKTAGDVSLKLFKTRRLVTPPTGDKRVMINGYIFGSRHTASITSSAADVKAADANFMQFAAGLWLVADDRVEKRR